MVEHSNKMVAEKEAFENRPPSVRKKEKNTLNLFEMLFFHLQMEPQYLVKFACYALTDWHKECLLLGKLI